MNRRSHSYKVGNMVLTGMTATEVKKLDKIMNPGYEHDKRLITVDEYIEKFDPEVRRWTSKKGTEMVTIEIKHDVLDENEDWIEQPAFHAGKKLLRLKEGVK